MRLCADVIACERGKYSICVEKHHIILQSTRRYICGRTYTQAHQSLVRCPFDSLWLRYCSVSVCRLSSRLDPGVPVMDQWASLSSSAAHTLWKARACPYKPRSACKRRVSGHELLRACMRSDIHVLKWHAQMCSAQYAAQLPLVAVTHTCRQNILIKVISVHSGQHHQKGRTHRGITHEKLLKVLCGRVHHLHAASAVQQANE
jgi:hypothetical protein